MKKIVSLAAGISILILAVWAGSLYASASMTRGEQKSYQTSDILGAYVMNQEGKYLGRVKDLVYEQNGRIIFAIIGFGKYLRVIGEDSVAVPFTALTQGSKEKQFVVDINWDKFRSAPRFSKDELMDRHQEAEVYRYFGQQPYWTEK